MKIVSIYWILGCILLSGCQNKELPSKHLTTLSVIRETESSNPVVNQPNTNAPATETQTPVPQATSTKYHVIVSSFGANEKARAERMVSQLRSKNYPATLLYSTQRYRVSIESFSSETEANAARDEYRAITDRQDIWVYKAN